MLCLFRIFWLSSLSLPNVRFAAFWRHVQKCYIMKQTCRKWDNSCVYLWTSSSTGACPMLRKISVHVGISDFYKNVNDPKHKSDYESLCKLFQVRNINSFYFTCFIFLTDLQKIRKCHYSELNWLSLSLSSFIIILLSEKYSQIFQ